MAQSFLFENGQLGPPVEVAFDWDDGAAAAGPSSSAEDDATSIAVLERAVSETLGLDDLLAFGIVYAPAERNPVPITTRADVEYCAQLQRTLGERITLSIVDTAELDAALLAIRSRSTPASANAAAAAEAADVHRAQQLTADPLPFGAGEWQGRVQGDPAPPPVLRGGARESNVAVNAAKNANASAGGMLMRSGRERRLSNADSPTGGRPLRVDIGGSAGSESSSVSPSRAASFSGLLSPRNGGAVPSSWWFQVRTPPLDCTNCI